ncbi:DNA mismatch repair protein Hsm3p [[Candida] anglica]|uniref:DNA mismatch repair protein HSM3 n=1 Tax=[Candida] anglica TaxID=148631 RepID=A0ABP0ENZ7_9ASCO
MNLYDYILDSNIRQSGFVNATLIIYRIMNFISFESYINDINNVSVDDTTILDYSRYFTHNPQEVLNHKSNFTSSIIPSINDIIINNPSLDPNMSLLELLNSIMVILPFEDIQLVYPESMILESIQSSNPQLTSLIIQIVLEKSNERDMIEFLEDSEFLVYATRTYFTESDDIQNLKVSSTYENLLAYIATVSPHLVDKLSNPELVSLYKKIRDDPEGNSTLFSRLLDFIIIIFPVSHEWIPTSLYKFSKIEFSIDDPLLVILLISFYKKFIQQINITSVILTTIKPSLYDIMELFTRRQQDSLIESFYAVEIVVLLYHWSHSDNKLLLGYLGELTDSFKIFKSYNLYLDELASDIELLASFNPDQINDKLDFLEDIIQLPLLQQRYFPIFLNILSSKDLFGKLVELNKLNIKSISKLSLDMIFKLLFTISNYKYSTHWLLSDAPQLMSDYVIASSAAISESEIWSLKKSILENLLNKNSSQELGVWKETIESTYSLMKNGRNVKDIIPRVEVATDTG